MKFGFDLFLHFEKSSNFLADVPPLNPRKSIVFSLVDLLEVIEVVWQTTDVEVFVPDRAVNKM